MLATFPLGQSIMRVLVLINIQLHTKFDMHSFIHSKDMMGRKIYKISYMTPDHAHLRVGCILRLTPGTAYLFTKFDDSSLSCSRDMSL